MHLRSSTNQESYNVTKTLTVIVKLLDKYSRKWIHAGSVYLFRTNNHQINYIDYLIIEISINEFSIYTRPLHLHLDKERENITKYIYILL